MENIFKGILKEKVVIVGIGNILRGDDGLGPELIRMLKGSFPQEGRFLLLDAGEAPENYLEKIVQYQPDTILLVDALDFAESPGSIRIIDRSELQEVGFSTHNASIKLTMNYLNSRAKCDVLLLGIQPANLGMGSSLSEPIKMALGRVEENLLKCTNLL